MFQEFGSGVSRNYLQSSGLSLCLDGTLTHHCGFCSGQTGVKGGSISTSLVEVFKEYLYCYYYHYCYYYYYSKSSQPLLLSSTNK